MTRLVYIFLLTGIGCAFELLLRNFGLFFPFCALFVFYTATAFGTGWGMTSACVGALALDSLGAGASHPWSIVIFSLVVWFASFWLHRVESDSLLLNSLPGLGIPFAVWGLSLCFFSSLHLSTLLYLFPAVLPAALLSAVVLPLMIFFLDALNEKLGLPLFTDAKLKLKKI